MLISPVIQPAVAAFKALLLAGGIFGNPSNDLDLGDLGSRGYEITGEAAGNALGSSVSGVGDVNQDGLADVILGQPQSESSQVIGRSFVTFGKPELQPIETEFLNSDGYMIASSYGGDFAGRAVAGAGDVNGDGISDVIIASPDRENGNGAANELSRAYVVFGKADTDAVTYATLGQGGFIIHAAATHQIISSVSGAGDVNGDGLADVVVGTPREVYEGDLFAGISYVVFGKNNSDPVHLATLGSAGFAINGGSSDRELGHSVSGAGDVNGDGLGDVVVGAPNRYLTGGNGTPRSYVVFGKTSSTPVNVANLGSRGFRIDGKEILDHTGASVSGAGDVNGDGLADVIIGAEYGLDPTDSGNAYVVFGKSDSGTVDLGDSNFGGFVLEGVNDNDKAGVSVSGAGDVNGDGLADLLVGAEYADPDGLDKAGAAYLIYGKADEDPVDLAFLGPHGYVINGAVPNGRAGRTLSGAGDVNGDGLADFIIGKVNYPHAYPWTAEGKGYVIFSSEIAPKSAKFRAHARIGNAPRMPIGTTGDGSNNDSPDSQLWIDFQGGKTPIIPTRGIPTSFAFDVHLYRSAGQFIQAAAPVHWYVGTKSTNWESAEITFRYPIGTGRTLRRGQGLKIYWAAKPGGPFKALETKHNSALRTLTVTTKRLGYFYIGT